MRRFFVVAIAGLALGAMGRAEDKPVEVKGTMTLGDQTFKLESAVAFEGKRGDKKRTTVLLSEKPADLDKLKQSLKKNGNDSDYFLFKPHVKLIFNEKGELFQFVYFAEGANVNLIESDEVTATATFKDGTAKGKAKLEKPGKIAGMAYTFEAEFNAKMIKPD